MIKIIVVVESIMGILLALNEALECPCVVETVRMILEAIVVLTGCF